MAVGWALLGTGRHADTNVAPQIVRAEGIRPVAVMSRDRTRGEVFARKHGFAKVCTSLSEVLDDPEIDALYDCTPDGLHADNTVAAAAAGKHMLVEKPLAMSLEDSARAIAACKQHGVKLGVVYNQRHEEAHREARRMVQEWAIGDIHLARVQVNLRPSTGRPSAQSSSWRTDPDFRYGGTLMSLGDHAFDTLAFLVDQRIEQIAAFTDATLPDPPNERVAGMMLKLSGGTIGHAVSSGRTPYARRPIEIHGSTGSIMIANSFAYLTGSSEDPRTSIELVNAAGTRVKYFERSECFRLEVEQFNRAIEGKGEPATTGEEGMRALAISRACYQAMRDGRIADVSMA